MGRPLMDADTLRASLRAVEMCGGNITRAADRLGVARTTLRDQVHQARERGITASGFVEKPRVRVQALSEPLDDFDDDALANAAARRAALRGEHGGPPIPLFARPPEGFVVTRNGAAYDEDGKLLRQWVGTQRDAGAIYDVPAGHVVKGESALLDADGRVKQRWVKTKEGASDDLAVAFRERFAEYEGHAPLIPAPAYTDDDLLVVYPLPDLHMGLYVWAKECGDSYDIELATDLIVRSVGQLVAQSQASKHAVILALGDLFHTNDQTNATPAHKHRLDVDSRWPKIYRAGATLMTTLVDLVAAKHDQVEVVNLPGNHDPDSSVCLTVALGMFYANNPRITVYEDPGLFWYRRFGKCLLGATHGHTVKMSALPMVMASDRARDWGETEHRSVFTGHIHHESAKEFGSVRIESLTTPAARDAYAHGGGYRSNRALSAITYHRHDGEIGRHRVNITRTAA